MMNERNKENKHFEGYLQTVVCSMKAVTDR